MNNDLYMSAKAWPFEQARMILKRLDIEKKRGIDHVGRPVLFETGYGPSGLPHIGTFGEVARTQMVRFAFHQLTNNTIPTRLIAFSDDMDGMRKVPSNVPNQALLEAHLGKPLSDVPDPFDTHDSFAAHNNARLCDFLDGFGFDYEFMSATHEYRSGHFDETLLRAAEKYDEIMSVMLPTLGAERQASYSPFLPISPSTGRVLYVPMKDVNAAKGEISFTDENGVDVTIPITGGHVKMQWKPDFGMRWANLQVDFEMFGKDHQANAPIYSRICKILGRDAPVQYVYELFLDDKGEKISKSKGNGISMEDWLRYASPHSLSLFMFQKPRTAKRLFFDVIPKAADEYFQFLKAYPEQDQKAQLSNPVHYIHNGAPAQMATPISFALLLNLVSAANASDAEILWGFISRYVPGATPQDYPILDDLVGYAIRYFEDFVKPHKTFRVATTQEAKALADLAQRLQQVPERMQSDAEHLQSLIFTVGKDHEFENLRDWFKAIYEVCLGQSQGPRFGSFVAIYGPNETAKLIDGALGGVFTA